MWLIMPKLRWSDLKTMASGVARKLSFLGIYRDPGYSCGGVYE